MSLTANNQRVRRTYVLDDKRYVAVTVSSVQFFDGIKGKVVNEQTTGIEIDGDGISHRDLEALIAWYASGFNPRDKPAFVP